MRARGVDASASAPRPIASLGVGREPGDGHVCLGESAMKCCGTALLSASSASLRRTLIFLFHPSQGEAAAPLHLGLLYFRPAVRGFQIRRAIARRDAVVHATVSPRKAVAAVFTGLRFYLFR